MARDLSVYRSADVIDLPPGNWKVRGGAEPLYEQPLGSESAIRTFWSDPASRLGLPLLAAISEHGFYHGVRWREGQLQAVRAEVDQLEGHWPHLSLPPDVIDDLQERARFMREATALAEEIDGCVVIT